MSNICQFQPLKCKGVLLFFVISDDTFNYRFMMNVFGLLVGQKRRFQDLTLGFSQFFDMCFTQRMIKYLAD